LETETKTETDTETGDRVQGSDSDPSAVALESPAYLDCLHVNLHKIPKVPMASASTTTSTSTTTSKSTEDAKDARIQDSVTVETALGRIVTVTCSTAAGTAHHHNDNVDNDDGENDNDDGLGCAHHNPQSPNPQSPIPRTIELSAWVPIVNLFWPGQVGLSPFGQLQPAGVDGCAAQ